MDSRKRRLLELKRDFLADAVGESRELVRLLEQSPVEHDGDVEGSHCRKLAHNLRGAGGCYGFPRVTECAGEIEEGLLAGRTSAELLPLVNELHVMLEDARDEFERQIAGDAVGEEQPA